LARVSIEQDLHAGLDPIGDPTQDARVVAATQRRILLATLLVTLALLAPLAVVAGVTAYEYFAGTVLRPGYPAGSKSRHEVFNLDPEYRIGCDLRDASGLLARTRKRTLDLMVRWFGPVPGSYQGPYPDREMAWAAVRSAQLVVEPTALSHPVIVDGQRFALLPTDVQHALGSVVRAPNDPYGTVALKVFEDTCLLLGQWSGGNYSVEMIDTSGVGWFARYVFSPDPY
jgi:hypothetical protein